MQPVGQGVVDGVDLGIGDQGLVGLVHGGHVVLGREGPPPFGVAGGHGRHFRLGQGAGGLDEGGRRDAGRPQTADSDPVHGPEPYGDTVSELQARALTGLGTAHGVR